jgi:hypothetical protein
MIGATFDALEHELSGERAREHVAQIGRFYRSPGSSGYHAALDYVIDALAAAGVEHRVFEFPLDGRTEVGGAPTPLAWEPSGGSLELLGAEPVVLGRWGDECGSCIPWWCPPTPASGAELELVDVGTGELDEDYSGRDVAGKAVLVHDSGESSGWLDVVDRAERHGAVGIVTNYLLFPYPPWRTRDGLPEAVQQLRLRPRSANPWTFTVSQPAFERLSSELRRGPAVVRFTVDAKTFESTSRSVLATIPGESGTAESVLYATHVSAATMPGANCASGVSLGLELTRSLRALIESGRLPRPRRNLHFLFANEELGSLALAESMPDLRANLAVAIAFCSVGHDQATTKSSLVVGRSLDALPTFVNDVVESLILLRPGQLPWAHFREGSREMPYVRWKVQPYTPWSDNATWSKLGVPGLLFMSLPDRYFHTQLLTAETTDPAVFVRCGAVSGTAGFLAAQAGWPEAGELMRHVAACSEARLNRVALEAEERVDRALDALAYLVDRDIASMRTALRLVPAEALAEAEALADRLEQALRAKTALLSTQLGARDGGGPPVSPPASAAAALVPHRAAGVSPLHGALGLSYAEMVELVEEMRRRDPTVLLDSLRLFADALWGLSSGQLDLGAIARAIGHEFGFDLAAEHVLRLAQALERDGYLELSSDRDPALPGR